MPGSTSEAIHSGYMIDTSAIAGVIVAASANPAAEPKSFVLIIGVLLHPPGTGLRFAQRQA